MIDENIRAALMENGFLASEVQQFPAMYREKAKDWFTMAENFNRAGQRVAVRAMEQGRGVDAPRAIGTALLLRTLQSYQAAIKLCSFGLATESRMLIRSCFENAFCIAALAHDPAKFIQALKDDDEAAKKAQIKFITQQPEVIPNLDKSEQVKFEKFINFLMKNLARCGNCQLPILPNRQS